MADNDWRKEARERIDERKAGNTHKMEVGDNTMRVAPDKKDIDSKTGKCTGIKHKPMREYRTHKDVGPDKVYNLRCGIEMNGTGKCWLCRKIAEIESTKPAMADRMHPQDNYVVNASRYDTDAKKFGPFKPWYISTGGRLPLSVRVGTKIISEKKDYLSPEKGYNITIVREGTGYKGKDATRYPEVEGDETPTRVPPQLLIAMKDLDEIVPKYDEEKQRKAFYGEPDDEDSGRGRRDRDDEDRPKRRREEDEDRPRRRRDEEDEPPADEAPADDDAPEELPADDADYQDDPPADDAEPEPDADPDVEPEEFEPEPDGEYEEGDSEPDADPDAEPDSDDQEPEPEPEPVRRSAPARRPATPAPAPRRTAPAAPPARRPSSTPAPARRPSSTPAPAPRRTVPPAKKR